MNKLFVDDIRNAPDDTWNIARTIDSAIVFIERFMPVEISLDHDISHQIGMGEMSRPYPCLDTYKPVARFIGVKFRSLEKRDPWYPKITIHSANPVGAEEMQKILADYGLQATIVRQNPANRLETIV